MSSEHDPVARLSVLARTLRTGGMVAPDPDLANALDALVVGRSFEESFGLDPNWRRTQAHEPRKIAGR